MSTPVTPQRTSRPATHSHSYSVSQSHFRSPASPSSPYTPLSLRSFSSSNTSPLVTPGSERNGPFHAHSLSFSSPLVKSASASPADRSLADAATNWRSRASENGIKVSSDANYSIEEVRDDDHYDRRGAGFITTEEALRPTSLTSTRRRRAMSQSQVVLPPSNNTSSPLARRTAPTSPLTTRNKMNQNALAATPPPNRNVSKHLKMKGSFTDPPQPRRREAFSNVPLMSYNVPQSANHSLDLFDIDENDYEYDDFEDLHIPVNYRNSELQFKPAPDYAPYPILTNAPSGLMPSSFGQPAFADPFNPTIGSRFPVNSALADNVDHQFHQYQHQNPFAHHTYAQPQPRHIPVVPQYPPGLGISRPPTSSTPIEMAPSPSLSRASTANQPLQPSAPISMNHSTCSVCSRSNPSQLAILSPCQHPLCSACLTSALNIVGEKDMECAVCKQPVADFSLISTKAPKNPLSPVDLNRNEVGKKQAKKMMMEEDEDHGHGQSFFDPLFSSPGSVMSSGHFGLDQTFGFLDNSDDIIRASTPSPRQVQRTSVTTSVPTPASTNARYPIVLRIDNVPWDITPPSIEAWLQQPILQAHVLLDKKGKTMSHAFVEVASEAIAGSILRGEVANSKSTRGNIEPKNSKRGRGAVLGRGRRARGVTITRSSQEELMAALFPSWLGNFDRSRPSLAGMDNLHVIRALETGFMTDSEVATLLYLIRSPDAHFLKVPSLPFYSLISVLSKFPGDVDSRVFWSSGLRDTLFDVTYAAIQVLYARIEGSKNEPTEDGEPEYTNVLAEKLIRAGAQCRAFTPAQSSKLSQLLDARNDRPSSYDHDADVEDEGEEEEDSWKTPISTTAGSRSTSDASSMGRTADGPQHKTNDIIERNNDQPIASTSTPIGDLAREFGVETELVEALVARLANAGMC